MRALQPLAARQERARAAGGGCDGCRVLGESVVVSWDSRNAACSS